MCNVASIHKCCPHLLEHRFRQLHLRTWFHRTCAAFRRCRGFKKCSVSLFFGSNLNSMLMFEHLPSFVKCRPIHEVQRNRLDKWKKWFSFVFLVVLFFSTIFRFFTDFLTFYVLFGEVQFFKDQITSELLMYMLLAHTKNHARKCFDIV